jgi:hypothetical protein
MSQRALEFRHFDAESYFVKRLGEHGQTVYLVRTDPDDRRERIRAAIMVGHLECTILGRRSDGKPENYADAFERLYGEPLTPRKHRGKRP